MRSRIVPERRTAASISARTSLDPARTRSACTLAGGGSPATPETSAKSIDAAARTATANETERSFVPPAKWDEEDRTGTSRRVDVSVSHQRWTGSPRKGGAG